MGLIYVPIKKMAPHMFMNQPTIGIRKSNNHAANVYVLEN